MAKTIIWTLRAQSDRKNILNYWIQRNRSSAYSKKLNQLFKEAVRVISLYPKIGKPTDDSLARVKVARDYLIFYEESEDAVLVLTIWDNRQNPDNLKI